MIDIEAAKKRFHEYTAGVDSFETEEEKEKFRLEFFGKPLEYKGKRKIWPNGAKANFRKQIHCRDKVLKRDNYQCQYCKGVNDLVIDHIIPLWRSGANVIDNMQVLCRTCNAKKGKT